MAMHFSESPEDLASQAEHLLVDEALFSNPYDGDDLCQNIANLKIRLPFEVMSKRRKGFPSETRVGRGDRVVQGEKELLEKLGRNDRCPCGSGRSFQEMLPQVRQI